MRRLAPSLAAAILALSAQPALAEPLDMDLERLGAPDPRVWQNLGVTDAATAAALAKDAKQRFGILSSDLALALSSAMLQPASTTGHSQFDIDMEIASVQIHPKAISSAPAPSFFTPPPAWPGHGSSNPGSLLLPSLHVRKALPFSFEVGGRMTYVSQSSYFAAQGEAKWSLNEGFDVLPDLGIRLAYTRLFGQMSWNLGATDLDLMVSKRWGVMGVTSFTPYAALRFTFLSASSDRMYFPKTPEPTSPSPDPATVDAQSAPFPTLRTTFFRTTLGLRFTSYSVSLATELTLFPGKKYSGTSNPTADQYPDFSVASSVGGAFKLGWEF
ncbi:MAG TPA: hypothetical protein VLT61_02905 [Anaeromyxobacteraceae bacterium]|nr:hypothetical protein [Anaeromyxobacteraceae bacterium]